MASLDLSAAFDIVNVPLLVKRLRVIGPPNDVVEFIEMWLRERYLNKVLNLAIEHQKSRYEHPYK